VAYDDGTLGAYAASQRAARDSHLHVTGTEGRVRLEPAYFGEVRATVTTDEGTVTVDAGETEEMREEFDYFAARVLAGEAVAPDGAHGLVDVETVGRLYEDAGLDL
jgi:xylose dehydrogenase (NAD/NADP)